VIRDATQAVARECSVPAFLQCLSRELMHRRAEHMATVQPDLEHLRHADLGTPDDVISFTVDTSDLLAARERAIAAHASQTSPYEGLPDDLRRAFLTREHLQAVRLS